jgi:TraY domain
MGRRGPEPRGEYPNKTGVLSTRIRPDTRKRLVEAAAASGRSLSQEIEFRLRRTLVDEPANAEMFGGLKNFRLMQLVGIAMTLRNPDRPGASWVDDPGLFVEVLRVIHHLLWAIRPPGTEQQFKLLGADDAQAVAESIWAMVHASDETLPINATARQHRANVLKADLGEIVDRPTYEFSTYIPPPPTPKKASRKKGEHK